MSDFQPSDGRIGFWDYTFDGYENAMRYTLDVESYIRDFSRKLSSIEDEVAEKLLVDWLRGRGYRVEREQE